MDEGRRKVLPAGTITFLFTDIEGSTLKARELGDEDWAVLLETHHRLLREAFATHGGVEIKTDGDAFLVAFERASDAVGAAVNGQRALEDHVWPDGQRVRVRMGAHTGEAIIREGDYVGHHVHRASRICDSGHGGQILVSQTTADLVGDLLPDGAVLRDLGLHRLKDLGDPERLFGVEAVGLQDDFPALRTLEGRPNNLPVQRSAFIGRSEEISRVREQLDTDPLVTLTGPGGAGKTRLAVQIGAEELDRHPDGVFFVDLAPLSDPDLVARTAADAVGLAFGSGISGGGSGSTSDLLVEALTRRRCLLVLDNCEHLLDACAELADQILTSSPDVRVLVTSREPLGVDGERVHRVPSLTLPAEATGGAPSEAVELFADRAAAVRTDFELTTDNMEAVEQICRRLDGLPLAIELAAARIAHLTPQTIAERLDDRFRLLTGGRRRVRRQQTLEAALDWSHELLEPDQQVLLRRLAVFAGSFSLAMAEQVCSGDGIEQAAVLDLLGSLVDKSLVVTETADEQARYRLLETVRSYAETKLEQAGEADRSRSRHRDTYLDWLESATWEDIFFDPDIVAALAREHSNIRAALEWSQAEGRHDLVGRLAARAIFRWGPGGGAGAEGHRWLSWALEDPEDLDRAQHAACLVALAAASTTLGEPELEVHAARALDLGREALAGGLIVPAFGFLALGASVRSIATGDDDVADEAREFAAQAVRAAEELGGPWPIDALVNHGSAAVLLGDMEAAERSLTTAVEGVAGRTHVYHGYVTSELAACRTLLGDPQGALDAARLGLESTSSTLRLRMANLLAAGLAELHRGASSEAAADLAAAIRIAESEGILLDVNECLIYAAAAAFESGDAPTSSRLLAAAVTVGAAQHTPIPFASPSGGALYRRYVTLVRDALGPEVSRRHRDEGRAMTREEALAAAREVVETLRRGQ